MAYLDIGLSSSTSISDKSSAGAGDFNVSGGGGKQTQTLFIVAGVVAVALIFAAALWLTKRK